MERLVFDAGDLDFPVVCPAGDKIYETSGGPACSCRLERAATGDPSIIMAATDPSSLARYCCGVHVACPTWRMAREAEWERSDVTRLTEPVGEARTHNVEDLLEIEERQSAGHADDAEVLRGEIMERKRERGLAPGIG